MPSICSNRYLGKHIRDNRADSSTEKTKRSMKDEKIVNIVAVTSSEVGMIFRLMLNNFPKVLRTPIRTTTTW